MNPSSDPFADPVPDLVPLSSSGDETPPIYYTTIFYPNYDNKFIQIVLEKQEKILEEDDIAKGYIEQSVLLDLFPDNITQEIIGENSMICEYKWSEDDDDSPEEMALTQKLRVV